MQPHAHEFDPALAAAHATARAFVEQLPTRAAASVAVAPAPVPLPPGIGAEAALAWFQSRWAYGLSASPGPRYWGFVTGGATPAALAADWLAAAYDQNASNDVGSLATAMEREALGWLRELFGLPAAFDGALVSGATAANTVALAAARQAVLARRGVDVAADGLAGAPPITVLAGAAHASIDKALAILGIGRSALRRLPLEPGSTRLDPAALGAALSGLSGAPAIVVASAGEVNTGSFDDLRAIAELCRRHAAWLHVDGAFGLFAALLPDGAQRLDGIDAADSIATDLHKWLNVPYDAGLVFTRDASLARAVFRASSAYLGDQGDPLHGTPENSRRLRALPAWMTLAAYGRDGVAGWVARDCALARRFAAGLATIPGVEVLHPVDLNVVTFALREGDAARRDRVLAGLAADGRVFLTPTVLFGRPALRGALANWSTRESDVDLALSALREVLAAS
ncbi:MAG: pyridoxal-dependent decarboxylase [Xanthomonadaceae bacterium]|jgi:glutamate/tyrosine decarboxylase-like PLP-dependent enzyme|nr:pyridoxal-dependent decarboxylase [Xanthomonadaceae bacterium]